MKREIKFRAWNAEYNQMIYLENSGLQYFDFECGYSLGFTVDGYNGFWAHEQYDTMSKKASLFPIMQFTGLQDKNGKDIYEGDICRRQLDEDNRYHSNGKWCDIWLIEWLEKTAGFTTTKVADYNVHLKKIVKIPHKQNSFSQRFHEMEVIGNVYENPDLISD